MPSLGTITIYICFFYFFYNQNTSAYSLFLIGVGIYILMLSISRFFGAPNHSQDENGGKTEGSFSYAYSATQGRRPYMEDVHLEQVPLGGHYPASGIFGVFDGHSGKKAAAYARDNIPRHLVHTMSSLEPTEALRRTFLSTDSDFCAKAEQENLSDGSTAIVALVVGTKLWVANAGDARCVLSSKGKAVAMSDDHKPNRESEKRRIIAAGGRVIFFGCWRVEGVLATSRGFGDKELKQYVTAEPEVMTHSLQTGDDYLILASDGLWDVMSNQDAVDILTKAPNIKTGAKMLTDEALKRGSMDNITSLVVDLRNITGGSPTAAQETIEVERGRDSKRTTTVLPRIPLAQRGANKSDLATRGSLSSGLGGSMSYSSSLDRKSSGPASLSTSKPDRFASTYSASQGSAAAASSAAPERPAAGLSKSSAYSRVGRGTFPKV